MATQTVVQDSKLKEFFIDQLKDIYWAEKKLVKTLPKLQDAATTQQLRDAFGNHLTQTEGHVERLEQVFGMIGEEVDSSKCQAMAGIVDEGEDIIDDTDEGTAQRDVGLIFAGQKAEHYEIATYGGLITLAQILGHEDAATIMQKTLAEEKEADHLLTQIAEHDVNYQAANEQAED
ncbi:MAG TPA: ferritin-like domain-containing protein [Mucilaginibacter sp.]|jgi:ferritin-like metal-binding protein YciE|nr:ferritin-like domain-containing protein [Mucilaginibacter sp.]